MVCEVCGAMIVCSPSEDLQNVTVLCLECAAKVKAFPRKNERAED